jgi:hypothetical protein
VFHDTGIILDWQRHYYFSGRTLLQVVKKVKVKVNFTLEQATKAQRRSRGIAILFL